ncbi:hypothetical protein P5P86_17985 [Nocardioides sp. BP30]|uniref:hypothetical protein n=1 Tax=Nocardioides sp. BP30 TaxID=3036374 RepID=UPI002468DE6C|nr:hypothetical protein [Nocardioides sp. BP30]WGL51832.1 hypothetical protein P5P86_17985 [Nocardioides sp. BP30]
MRRRWAALVVAGVLLVVAALTGFALTPSAQATGTQTYAKTVNRVFYGADGTTTPADPANPDGYDVKLTVSSTQNLRGNQPITVSWSGAHPTGGVVSDPSYGYDGSEQEYPLVLMECRGTAATVKPETCWTQTSAERIQTANTVTSAPVWRADGAAASADRAAQVDLPTVNRPSTCATQRFERWVPLVAASGTTYYGGGVGCYDLAPEGSDEPTTGVPDNTTYGITGTDGKGTAQFAVWTADENATLGCSASVACSLVAIPVTGIDCDPNFTQVDAGDPIIPTAAQQARYATSCEKPDVYQPGQSADGSGANFNLATSGRLWWSASNWDNRIVVPLNFAVSGSTCSLVNSTAPLLAYGSILMTDIAAQWQPAFCTTKGYQPFLHVQATDIQARSLVDQQSIKIGLSSDPPDGGFTAPIAQAPVAVTGFAIAYNIDGADGQPVTDLKLNARLLAKLLTESYNGDLQGRKAYPALAGNPRTIFADPEFHALNPDVDTSIPGVANAAAALISLSNDSDMLTALSSYILSDSDAKHWLDGERDPWGMKVNPAYQLDLPASQNPSSPHLTLPVSSWPLLDDFELDGTGSNACMKDVPYLAQIAHPLSQVSTIEEDLEFAISNSQTVCPTITDANDPSQLVPKTEGQQPVGHRFVIGVVPLTAVSRYGLRAAALETSSDIGPETTFTDASGKTFASPDTAGMKTAVKLLSADTDAGAWTVDYDELDSQTGAYPGLMPVYADVPTKGLGSADAARVAQLLDFAAGSGQSAGTANGQLAPGALPMTSANGLGAEAAYTRCVAVQVRAQTGVVPSLSGACPAVPKTAKPSATASANASATPSAAAATATTSTAAVAAPPVPSASVSPAPATSPVTTTADSIKTVGAYSRIGRFGLPFALIAGLCLLVAGLALRWCEEIAAGSRVIGRWSGPWLSRTSARLARRHG